jgi:hypothetical protein
MPDSPRTLAEQLVHERGLGLVAAVLALGVYTFVRGLVPVITGADDPVSAVAIHVLASLLWVAFVMLPMIVLSVMGVLSVRAVWVAQRKVREAARNSRNVRAITADPHSPYGLPGFPDASPGTGDLGMVDHGALTETTSETGEEPPA